MHRIGRLALMLVMVVAALYIIGRAGILLREQESLEHAARRAPGRLIKIEGNRVHVLERGSGAALVLIHGFSGSTFDWEQHVLDPLAQHYRVIAVDLWGHGFSERRPRDDLGFVMFAEQIEAVLQTLGVARTAVAGHSMGGAVAVLLAARHPERVDHLVLIAGLAPSRSDETPWVFRVLSTPVLGEFGMGVTPNLAPPEAPPDYRERMALVSQIRGTRMSLLRYVRGSGKMDQLREAYPRIAAPALIIHGRADANVPFAAVERILPLIPHAEVVPLDGKGHWLLWEAPERVVAEMVRFLSSPRPQPNNLFHPTAAAGQSR